MESKTEYQILDTTIQKSQRIKTFCEDRLKLCMGFLEMKHSTEFKIHWLKQIENELDKLIDSIERVENGRVSSILSTKIE